MSAFPVQNPLTGATLYELMPAGGDEITACMTRARQASEMLEQTPVAQRLEAIEALVHWIQAHREWLLDRIVAESGRCRTDAMISDVFQLTEDCQWLVRHAASILADEKVGTPITLLGKRSEVIHAPHGVVLVISPWNLPLAIGLTATMFALAAGNAVVLKPSEHTPMANVLEQVQSLHPLFEQGLQVVHGGGDTGAALIEERPDHIVFTGSLSTGRAILTQAAPLMIPVTLELGSRDLMLVFADADRGRAVNAAAWGKLHNSGQSCTAVERILVQDALFDSFVAELGERLSAARRGVGANAELGVPTTDFQMRHIEELVNDARRRGAQVHCGGGRSECGRYFLPTLLSGVPAEARILAEEVFGPVVVLEPFADEDEAVGRHNERDCGLSTSVFTRDRARARRLAHRLRTGSVNINNVMLTEGNPGLPFGGVKYSGYGRMKGREGLLGMTVSRAVLSDFSGAPAEPNWHPYSGDKLAVFGHLLDALTRRGPGRLLRLAGAGWAVEKLLRRQRREPA